jgi:hypothetical protein
MGPQGSSKFLLLSFLWVSTNLFSFITQRLDDNLKIFKKVSDGLNQKTIATKHSFLFRGAFRKLEKQKQKENKTPADSL